jgi:tRNA A-37 threonylcarbamoyl transferase component Bud32
MVDLQFAKLSSGRLMPCLFHSLTHAVGALPLQAIARQLVEAVAYIHELGLVHTDLKPENILMAAQEHMKLPPVPPAA